MKVITDFNPVSAPSLTDWTATQEFYEPGDTIGRGPTKDKAIENLLTQLSEPREEMMA